MIDLVPEWEPEWATVQFVLFMLAPLFWAGWRRSTSRTSRQQPGLPPSRLSLPPSLAFIEAKLPGLLGLLFVGCLAIFVRSEWVVEGPLDGLPPAYHDEYSYRLEARLVADGKWSIPSPPVMPEMFNQVHVLNEGRIASRYYPGTAFWLAPFELAGNIHAGQQTAQFVLVLLTFVIGYELGGNRCGLFASTVAAISPGLVIFSQLLLSHHPTLVGTALFLAGIIPLIRSLENPNSSMPDNPTRVPRWVWASLSTTGLSFAMICRPATAFAIGLPFGIYLVWRLLRPQLPGPRLTSRERLKLTIALGWPLLVGWSIMLAYNASVTGRVWQSPYQLYTEIYTPRHVFGFDNVVRGAQSTSPKIMTTYDNWATNLTLLLAFQNLFTRLLGSWIWTFDPLIMLITSVGSLWLAWRHLIWRLMLLSIVALHLVHFPYWYAGIMGWHYVFESSLLWIVLFSGLATSLVNAWQQTGRPLALWWLAAVCSLAVVSAHLTPQLGAESSGTAGGRFGRAVSSLRYPMWQYAEFDIWQKTALLRQPALLLLTQDSFNSQLDYLDNHPRDLANPASAPLLRARWNPAQFSLDAIVAAYPERNIYVVDVTNRSIRRFLPANSRSDSSLLKRLNRLTE